MSKTFYSRLSTITKMNSFDEKWQLNSPGRRSYTTLKQIFLQVCCL